MTGNHSEPTHLRWGRLLAAAALLLLPAMPQTPPPDTRTAVQGVVLDASRAPIAGARIAVDQPGHPAVSAISDAAGQFSLQLEAGRSVLKVVADGFQEVSQTLELPPAGGQPLEFILPVAGTHQTVTVSEAAGYQVGVISSGTKTLTPLHDVPQSVTVVTRELISNQLMTSLGDVVRYMPGITAIQGENNRDQVVIRGNSSSADFFLNGVRDDVQYYRDLYNIERVEALMGPDAMIFGRGGGGGVVNRVTKEADFMPIREFTLDGGSFDTRRITSDFGQPLGDKFAFRFNGVYENSGSFRDFVSLKRFAFNPTMTWTPTKHTKITLGYEHLRDDRVADRGIPSFQGRPVDAPIATYYGNPNESHVGARVNLGSVAIEHQFSRLKIQNRTMIGNYDRGYQNFVPGAVTADKTQVSLSAYNNATRRQNIINQTDLTYSLSTGRIQHTLLAGAELSHEPTDNFRNTGYFGATATSILVPYSNPLLPNQIAFRQSATDADNHVQANVAAVYVQDQMQLSRYVQVIAGVRLDHFDMQYHDNRAGTNLRRIDNMPSPRAALVFKPTTKLSLYGSYSISHLPSSGDQFSSLTSITQQVKPEQFTNYEGGAKFDVNRNLSLTAAVFRLDRTNTRATDPNDPTRIVQTGSQRTNGVELGWNGSITRAWKIAGGYSYEDGFVTSATTATAAGAHSAQTPHNTFSLWNRYQILPKLGAGLGILHRADMFAAIDNTVTLPSYTRVDAAVYYSLTEKMRLQANVENLFDQRYYINADSNTNISPGSPRAIRVALTARF